MYVCVFACAYTCVREDRCVCAGVQSFRLAFAFYLSVEDMHTSGVKQFENRFVVLLDLFNAESRLRRGTCMDRNLRNMRRWNLYLALRCYHQKESAFSLAAAYAL